MFNSASRTAERRLSPGDLAAKSATVAFRKGSTASSVAGASQFIPLLSWEEDRGPSQDLLTLPTLSNSVESIPESNSHRHQVADSDASISSSSDEEFKPAARRVRRVAALNSRRKALTTTVDALRGTGVGTLAKQELTPQDTHKAVTPANLRLFRPGQKPQHGSGSLPASSAGMQSTDFQANVNAIAQQAREQQLKQKQAAAAAEVELDRLKGLLQREKALQASVAKGSIRLADNGARLAGRLAQLDDDIARQSELVQMYAEQLVPATQDNLSASAFKNNMSSQNMGGQQQHHPVPSSRHAQIAGQQQNQIQGFANGHVLHQGAHRAEVRQVPASSSAPGSRQPRSRHTATDRHARSSVDRRHQHDSHSNGCEGRGRPALAASKQRQAAQSPNAKRNRQDPATDSRPNKRQKQQASSRALQRQRQTWMDRLTADAAQEMKKAVAQAKVCLQAAQQRQKKYAVCLQAAMQTLLNHVTDLLAKRVLARCKAAKAEAAAWAVEYQPSWTYQDDQGASQGPFQLAELKVMLSKGRLQDNTMVHDEEAEISIRLATLIANSQRNRTAIEPLPVRVSEVPVRIGNDAAVADGNAAAKTEASQGGSQGMVREEGRNQIKQEVSASPPSFDSLGDSMDIGNSDAESPDQAAAGPVDQMWSPQYSPAKLAELVPVMHSPVPNALHHAGSSAIADSHPQTSNSGSGRSAHPQGPAKHLPSHRHQSHEAAADAQGMHQHLPQGGCWEDGDLFPDPSSEHSNQARSHFLAPRSTFDAAPAPPSPPLAPPSYPLPIRPHSPSYALDAMKAPDHSIPAHSGQRLDPGLQWQANLPPGEQQMSRHHRQDGYPIAGPLHAAPGQGANQSEQQQLQQPQQPQQLAYSPTRPDTHHQAHSTHLPPRSFSQQGRAHSREQHYPPGPPQVHHHTQSTCDPPHPHHGRAYRQGHSALSSASLGSRQGSLALPIPAPHASQHLLHGQTPQGFPASSVVQQPRPQPHHRQDHAVHIQLEPGSAPPPPCHAAQPVDQAGHPAPSNHQLQPLAQAQSATVLSPELSAALAAGLFGQSVPVSENWETKRQQDQSGQPELHSQQLDGSKVASALPPELSAALASGHLNFQLGGSAAGSHRQQAGLPAYQPKQTGFQPEQASFQPRQSAYQSQQAASQPAPAGGYQPDQAAVQPGQAVPYQHDQAAYHPERPIFWPGAAVAYQPGQAANQPGPAAEQAAYQSGQAAYQTHHHETRQGAGEHPYETADPAGVVHRHPHAQLPGVSVDSARHGSRQEIWQTSHNAGLVAERPLQMTMNSPTLRTQPHAAASHRDFAVGSCPLPVSPSGLQQGAVHDPQHAQHRLQHAQHVPQQAQHASQQAQQGPQHGPNVSQQAQHGPQRAQHGPQQAQHVSRQTLYVPQQAQQVLQAEDDCIRQPHHVLQPRPVESTARLVSMPPNAQHEPGGRDVQRPAVHAEYRVGHQLPPSEYQPEQQWQARHSYKGPPVYDDHGQWPAREQWEDPGFEGQDSHGNHPMTEEEAEWEWQRQLAEQEGSQEEDDRYDDYQSAQHAPDGYDDQYVAMSPRAPWAAQSPRENWQGAHLGSHGRSMGPGNHSDDAANLEHHPRHLDRQYEPGHLDRQYEPGHLDRQYEQQAHGEHHDLEGQASVGDGQCRRHRRGGRRHRRPLLAPYPGTAPTRFPGGINAGAPDSDVSEGQPRTDAEMYGGQSRGNPRGIIAGTSRFHPGGGAVDPRGGAAGPRGAAVDPRGAAVDPRGGVVNSRGGVASPRGRNQRALAPGRGGHHSGRSGGRPSEYTQQAGGFNAPQRLPSDPARNRAEPASWPRGRQNQHGSNRGHQGPHQQSELEYQTERATLPYAQQSGYPR